MTAVLFVVQKTHHWISLCLRVSNYVSYALRSLCSTFGYCNFAKLFHVVAKSSLT